MKNSEILKEAKNLISKPDTWIKGCTSAGPILNKDGVIINDYTIKFGGHDKNSYKWCSIGAVEKVLNKKITAQDYANTVKYLSEASKKITVKTPDGEKTGLTIVEFNDVKQVNHDMIMDVFDSAIAAAVLNND